MEETPAPMYLTNDRLRDRGEIMGSFHLPCVQHGAVSLGAPRGQQLLVVPAPAGRGKLPQWSNLLSTPLHRKQRNYRVFRISVFASSAPSGKSFICVPISIHTSSTVRVKAAKVTCFEDKRMKMSLRE